MNLLPTTGTAALLERLSPYVPDDFINSLFAMKSGPGRPAHFCPSQLFRVLCLTLLTPAHSFNLLVELLGENRSWRDFARLRNRHELPDAKMLHQFRDRLDLIKLRGINARLLEPMLAQCAGFPKTVAIIDSTDLPAATNAYKKNLTDNTVLAELTLGLAAVRKDRVVISSGTKNTPCVCGFVSIAPVFCWCPWYRGRPRQTGMIRCFWSPASTTAHANGSGHLTLWLAI